LKLNNFAKKIFVFIILEIGLYKHKNSASFLVAIEEQNWWFEKLHLKARIRKEARNPLKT